MKLRLLPLVAAAVLVSACASAPPERTLSTEVSRYASLPNGHDPVNPAQFRPMLVASNEAYRDGVIPYFEARLGRPLTIIEFSGGGQNGAFSAGLLNGWTQSGARPRLDIVTGVSTGALVATHAFLGTPQDDAKLREVFTSIDKTDIYTENGLLGVAFGQTAFFDTEPLRALLKEIITPEVLARVAAAYDEGRRLLVGTTNLDYGQTWVWNLTQIAKEARPGYEQLYRDVLLASASPPVAFPPVPIDGHLFADGGTRSNLLAIGLAGGAEPTPPLHGPGDIYVVNNGRLGSKPKAIPDSFKGIASDGVNTALTAAMESALLRSYFATVSWGYRFHYVEIPAGIDIGNDMLAFDQKQMRAAYDAGRALGLKPTSWSTEPALLTDMPPWALEEIRRRSP